MPTEIAYYGILSRLIFYDFFIYLNEIYISW